MNNTADSTRINLAKLHGNVKVLDMLLEFERTLDNCNIYAYQNWDKGELVDGPHISRYWFTTTWMYPYEDMPDPDGGQRLLKYGCKVKFSQDYFKAPKKVTGHKDYENPSTKQAKIEDLPIWLVKITMPRKFIDEAIEDELSDFIDTSVTDEVSPEDVSDTETDNFDGIKDVDQGM